jgi:hypothetical protein
MFKEMKNTNSLTWLTMPFDLVNNISVTTVPYFFYYEVGIGILTFRVECLTR